MNPEIATLLAKLFDTDMPDFNAFRTQSRVSLQSLRDRDLAVGLTVQRLGFALQTMFDERDRNSIYGIPDVVALIRQFIRWEGPLTVNPILWDSLRKHAEPARLVGGVLADGRIEISADDWTPDWLNYSQGIDRLELRRDDPEAAGDGLLYRVAQLGGLDWTTYRSEAQKAAVDCWLFAPSGTTTLVTLPTGGGKSLCILLPAVFESEGGHYSKGTTLVVVPTVALAHDQVRQSERFFRNSAGEMLKPHSRTGENSLEERHQIEQSLRDGSLPILYTSPESLLQSHLHEACLKAAQEGLLSRLVIDEAHLIETWGTGFRPEFQLLAAYRRKLLEASSGRLRTLLLSATVSESSRSTLQDLFSEPDKLIVVKANRLRPEISYWFSVSGSDHVRRERVFSALTFLPRPMILYVTQPRTAEEWAALLRKRGYARVASFTGKTSDDQRRRLLADWNENRIDVMVATSAFGLGVDKGDVRSVIHATLPENIDRFYQEVGRGGRDGCSAVSLVCGWFNEAQNDDIKLAYSLNKRLITSKKLLPRWNAMISSSKLDEANIHIRWIDRDSTPEPTMTRGEVNRDWNDHLLLLMQRAKLIEIIDTAPPRLDDDGALGFWLPIRILDSTIFNDPESQIEALETHRAEEKGSANAARGIIELVSDFGRDKAERCIAHRFADIYEDVGLACGGCPTCRREGVEPYHEPLRVDLEYPATLRSLVTHQEGIAPLLAEKLGAWKSLHITWTGSRTLEALRPCLDVIPELLLMGFQQIVYPDELLQERDICTELVRALAKPDMFRPTPIHRVIPQTWISTGDYPLFPLATVILYPPQERAADALYRAFQWAQSDGVVFPGIIHVVHEALALPSAGKRFTDAVDGLTYSLERMRRLLDGGQEMPDLI